MGQAFLLVQIVEDLIQMRAREYLISLEDSGRYFVEFPYLFTPILMLCTK